MRFKTKFLMVTLAGMLALSVEAGASVWPSACGSDSIQYKVKTKGKEPMPGTPEAGKAQIVFIESLEGTFAAAPTIRFGVDGSWVGADHGASYFSISVAPGQYHLCASRQSSAHAEKENVGIATANVEAGKVYFYEFKVTRTEVGFLNRADGGGSGAGGLMPSTPNMTAREGESVDTAEFNLLSEADASRLLRHASLSLSTPKNTLDSAPPPPGR